MIGVHVKLVIFGRILRHGFLKAGSHDAIGIIRFFCTIMLKPKIYLTSQ